MAEFKHLKAPYDFKQFYSEYPEGYTIYEALLEWLNHVNTMVDSVNDWNVYLDEFVAKFDESLQDEVTQTLKDWQTSGLIDDLISEALQWDLDNYITTNEQDKLSINTQLSQKADLIYVNEKTQQKADLIYVNEKIQGATTQWKMSFNTLADLETEFPTGDEFNHVVLSNGMIYTWFNGAWSNTNILANAQKLAENIVKPSNTTFLTPIKTRNLFDGKWVVGSINGTTGEETDVTYFTRSDKYYEVTPGQTYTLNITGVSEGVRIYRYYYNSNKTILSYLNTSKNFTYTFTPEIGVAFVRFAVFINSVPAGDIMPETTQFEKGGQPTQYVEPYIYNFNERYINVDNAINQQSIIESTQWGNDYVKGVAHRGYSFEAPENTAPAYILAKKKGFKYVETDIWFTSDGVPVLQHDQTVDRNSNGTGDIETLTLSYLKSLDFGSWFSPEYTGTQILTFEEFLKLCKKLNLHPYVQMNSALTVERASLMSSMAKKLGMTDKITWLGNYVTNIRNYIPKARIGFFDHTLPMGYLVGLKVDGGNVLLDIESRYVDQALSDSCATNGIELEAWIVNSESEVLRLANLNVTGITTDKLNIGQILQNNVN